MGEEDHESANLMDTLEAIDSDTSGSRISFGDAVEVLNNRGFGALLILPSLIIIMPTGIIPGIPAICGIFMLLISGQMVLGKKAPWLPQKLRKISISKARFNRAVDSASIYIKRVDSLTAPRLQFLTSDVFQRTIAGITMVLSLGIIGIGFIPFVPLLLALPILFFALGLSVKDGIFMLIGFSFIALAVLVAPMIAAHFFE